MRTITHHPVPDPILNDLVERIKGKPGALLTILEEAQELNSFKFLPEETISKIAKKLGIPYTQAYSVATFYSFFNLQPQGKHTITVCRGTACHTKGSKSLLNDLYPMLGVPLSQQDNEQTYTTPDNLFTIKTVACFGQCALAPVVAINENIYSNMNTRKLIQLIQQIKTVEEKEIVSIQAL